MKIFVDLVFQVMGTRIPVDHGYQLFSSISKVLPVFHEAQDIRLGLIRGKYLGDGLLDIHPKTELVLRLPSDGIAKFINLAGKRLDIDGCCVQIGIPNTRALIPAASLYAHIVTTKNGNEEPRFQNEISHQVEKLGIDGKLHIGERRTFRVHDKQVVGYSVSIDELTAEESIALQEAGLGGRRKMGCGFFEPLKS